MAYNPTTNSFDTITDLTTQVGTPGATVMVSGATAFNDGGGGPYFWDSTSTATPNSTDTIQVTGITTGRWMRSKNNNYTVGTFNFNVISS